jgi:hypothetical protein
VEWRKREKPKRARGRRSEEELETIRAKIVGGGRRRRRRRRRRRKGRISVSFWKRTEGIAGALQVPSSPDSLITEGARRQVLTLPHLSHTLARPAHLQKRR